jgi:pimeloyl-ACP methyl ester carboxylesterase
VKKLKLLPNFMTKTKILYFLIGILLCQICTALADPWSNRLSVTIQGHGPDVILIPGLTCSRAVWDATANHLKDHYRLHIVQIDGFAGSPAQANAQGPVIEPALDALNAYIKTNQLKSPRIIGHSLGGTMGLMLALQHPEDVGSLLVVDALPFTGMLLGADDVASAAPKAAKMRDNTLKESPEAYARDQKKFIRILVKSPDGRALVTSWAVASDKSVVARATYEDLTTDLRPQLPNIKIPVTILYAWDDSSPYSKSDTDGFYSQLYDGLPHKTMIRIDNSYHFIMIDQPQAFLAQVDKFLGLPAAP